jgi:hypothetical protein
MNGGLNMDPVFLAKTALKAIKNNPFLTIEDKEVIRNFECLTTFTKHDAHKILNLQTKLNRKQYKLNRQLRQGTK